MKNESASYIVCVLNKKTRTGPTQFKIILAEEHIALRAVSSLTSAIITPTSFVS